MVISTLLFPPPSSLFVKAMSILSRVSLANGGYMETKGKHMQYSKNRKKKVLFLNVIAGKFQPTHVGIPPLKRTNCVCSHHRSPPTTGRLSRIFTSRTLPDSLIRRITPFYFNPFSSTSLCTASPKATSWRF
ncbi:hypothetical protein L6452_37589 [Arctium lappa]|uniref:Uncharacterized protein n=1 Tax=Arctium lappa TaxID=4217 RepID=A0ACB8Y3D3_ARCLA|nr:hypothetical protein L6452_37589 [Arctium lappa]